jgi:hypothetical protein
MLAKIFLFKVEDHFQLSKLGLVVTPGIPLRCYDGPSLVDLFLKKPDGSEVEEKAQIYYSFPIPPPHRKMLTVLFPHLTKADVPIGTEIWFVGAAHNSD